MSAPVAAITDAAIAANISLADTEERELQSAAKRELLRQKLKDRAQGK